MHKIRHLQSSDYDKGYFDLLETLTTVDQHLITFDMFDNFIKNLNENHIVHVIELDDLIIASGTLFIENKIIHGCGKVGHIEDIVVYPSYKGKQLGSLIVNSLVKYANDRQCYKVILDCDNKLINFYDKCGFELNGSQMSLYF